MEDDLVEDLDNPHVSLGFLEGGGGADLAAFAAALFCFAAALFSSRHRAMHS